MIINKIKLILQRNNKQKIIIKINNYLNLINLKIMNFNLIINNNLLKFKICCKIKNEIMKVKI